jgi:hypothetical protein
MQLATVRTWCEEAGMSGTDLDSALTCWQKSGGVDDSDGGRVQRIVEVRSLRAALDG